MVTDAQQIMSYRDFVPTSTKVISRLNKFPIKFVDPKVVLDENEKWDRLYDDIFIKSAKKK
jgi:iron(III) transport system substrate-binding protein